MAPETKPSWKGRFHAAHDHLERHLLVVHRHQNARLREATTGPRPDSVPTKIRCRNEDSVPAKLHPYLRATRLGHSRSSVDLCQSHRAVGHSWGFIFTLAPRFSRFGSAASLTQRELALSKSVHCVRDRRRISRSAILPNSRSPLRADRFYARFRGRPLWSTPRRRAHAGQPL